MTDALAILVSCGLLIFVILRAIKLDASLPWFESRPDQPAPAEKGPPHQGILSASSFAAGRGRDADRR